MEKSKLCYMIENFGYRLLKNGYSSDDKDILYDLFLSILEMSNQSFIELFFILDLVLICDDIDIEDSDIKNIIKKIKIKNMQILIDLYKIDFGKCLELINNPVFQKCIEGAD